MVAIGGVERNLNACPPSRLRFEFNRPSAETVADFLPPRARISGFPTDLDQGPLNACVEFSIAERYEQVLGVRFSPLFGFFFARTAEGDKPTENVGLSIPDALAIAHAQGLCRETTWPYDPAAIAVAPPVNAIAEARMHRLLRYEAIADLLHLKETVASGEPVLLGFDVPASISSAETEETGDVSLPHGGDPVIGRHAVNAIAYDDARGAVGCTSHWGSAFGDHGLLWLPYACWEFGRAADMFALRAVAGAALARAA